MTAHVQVSKTRVDEAASIINKAIENHATAVDLTGVGVLAHVLEILDIQIYTELDLTGEVNVST